MPEMPGQLLPRERRHRRFRPDAGVAVARFPPEHQPRYQLLGDKSRVILAPPQIRQMFPPHPFQLMLRESRVLYHIGQQRQHFRPMAGQGFR